MDKTAIQACMQALHDRFACKRYTETLISEADLHTILESGRLSPTSFGLEGWHFHVVQNSSLREALTSACFDQESVATAPITIVIAALTKDSYDPYGPFVRERGLRFPGTIDEFIDDYKGYHEFLASEDRLDCWSRAQCYIAAANMMQTAVLLGIQSCAIEGFDDATLSAVINLDRETWQPALAITFGYPDEPIRPKIRADLATLVSRH